MSHVGVAVFDVCIITAAGSEPAGGRRAETVSGLESLATGFRRMGMSIQIRFEEFHRRRIVLMSTASTVELTLDRGLHGWRRPHSEAASASLAARRTVDQYVVIRQVRPATPLGSRSLGCVQPSMRRLRPVRIRQLLYEIEQLRRAQLAGQLLNPSQSRKVARESVLRECLAQE